MFTKILIANRGEIACRVMETARRLGVKTVAIYSDADAGAKHVALADEVLHIGPPQVAESYLKGDLIIDLALTVGAQAIHPGYGFLSENPDFVDAVEKAGLTFIGPSADAIRAMGLKDAAKKLMEEAGVPVVPGYHGDDQADERLSEEAARIGYPVLIKAVAGGGGKGMRKVDDRSQFSHALASAKSEAMSAFGNDAVLIEKFVQSPRHIEVQVFGDGVDALHLFERDCSLQRRHQKVIEEAPAPGMTEGMRAAMGDAAVRAAKAIGYKGAGTVEFIVDGSDGLRPDKFWFMEMNTRLQVEHPVTEAITGVDLVEWQLRVAAGEALPARQDDLTITGHAFEARLYAEDVPAGFLPATGTLTHLKFSDRARNDSGVRAGDTISPFYDPMIAKVITHGPTREIALMQLGAALEETEVAGSVTNLAFLGALTRHDGFKAGDVDTGLIDRDLDALIETAEPLAQCIAQAALAAAGLLDNAGFETGFTLWEPLNRNISLIYGDVTHEVTLRSTASDHHWVDVGNVVVEALNGPSGWTFDGTPAVPMARQNDTVSLFTGPGFHFTLSDPLDREMGAGHAEGITLAPMPGLVKAVFVSAGQTVAKGDRLAVLEAMKMEHSLTAARDGVIAEVLTAEGAQVEAGAPLIRLEEDDA